MEDKVYVAPSERVGDYEESAPAPVVPTTAPVAPALTPAPFVEPTSLEDVIKGLKGFGIEENEEILTFVASGRTVRIRISNIPTEQEMQALLASEDFKGYTWVQRIRCEILSRAITYIDGINITELSESQRIIPDPTTKEKAKRDIQVVLRNILLGWGQELLTTLWKLLMVHSDKIEKRLKDSFPESAIMTEVERRFFDVALKEIEDATKAVVSDAIAETLEGELTEEDKTEFKQLVKQGLK
jgi:hypothetical protein